MSEQTRPLSTIASEIRRDWTNPYFGAKPYIEAMGALETMNDNYGSDSAIAVVSYFLANAAQWRGETARRVKQELKTMLRQSR